MSMTLLTKTFLSFFLLIYIGCVTYGPKEAIIYGGQSSGSKVEDEEFKTDLRFCEMALFVAFKHDDPLDNFCEAFLNINGDNFVGIQGTDTDMARGYYYDLLVTVQKLNLPQLMPPKIFCRMHYRNDADDCIHTIKNAGCDVDADGITSIYHLYLNWKKRDENTSTPIPGTENISDEMLLQAIYSGYQNPYNIADEDLLQEYYITYGYPRVSEEEIKNHYRLYIRNLPAGIQRRDALNFESFRSMLLDSELPNDLNEARYERYGVRSASYINIFREYVRRQNLHRFYDNYYANYLISEIKKSDCSKFKNRMEYCKQYLKKMRSQQLGS